MDQNRLGIKLRNTYKETPEIPLNNSPHDIINEIFENVPVSLGKQHFSPKLGFKILKATLVW